MPTCRECGEPIIFILTQPKRRNMPVDPDEVTERLQIGVAGEVVLVTKDGVTFRGRRLQPGEDGGTIVTGYVSHFSTCSHPEKFRRKT